jgi:hypothetical protein
MTRERLWSGYTLKSKQNSEIDETGGRIMHVSTAKGEAHMISSGEASNSTAWD